ncbi:MAG: hypothetical protein OEZ68_10085 [Gammaproteobacteria bacterium]|nr:hypothetical protein [Gammaproteobacteria bacterium]MDH5801138.1 hypothetical protein [Gammaproteobacteria bacterium]
MTFNMTRIVDTFLLIAFPLALLALFSSEPKASETSLDDAANATKVQAIIEDYAHPRFADLISPLVTETRHMPKAPGVPQACVLNFATGQYEIGSSDLRILRQHAKFLAANPGLLLIVSHTVESVALDGLDQLNRQRSETVFQSLLRYGAPPEQIMVDAGNSGLDGRVELQYTALPLQHINSAI